MDITKPRGGLINMKDLKFYHELIEKRLDIMNCLILRSDRIIPNTEILNKSMIKENLWDDLFGYHNGKLIFSNRFLSFVSEITDRNVLTSHYFLELKESES